MHHAGADRIARRAGGTGRTADWLKEMGEALNRQPTSRPRRGTRAYTMAYKRLVASPSESPRASSRAR